MVLLPQNISFLLNFCSHIWNLKKNKLLCCGFEKIKGKTTTINSTLSANTKIRTKRRPLVASQQSGTAWRRGTGPPPSSAAPAHTGPPC